MAVSFVTIGNFGIDNVVSADGVVELRKIGGNAIFSAFGLHYWTDDVGISTTIPINYPSEWLDKLSEAGINLDGVRRVEPAIEREEWFFYQPDGSRIDGLYARYEDYQHLSRNMLPLSRSKVLNMIECMRNDESMGGVSLADFRKLNPLTPDDIPESYLPIRACHVAPIYYPHHLALARSIHERGIYVSLDPAPYTGNLSQNMLAELLAHVDIFLPSQKELSVICPDWDTKTAIRNLAEMGPSAIVVKMGSEGAFVCDCIGKEIHPIPAYPAKIKDLTGAGDAFCGGFMFGMVETGDVFMAAHYGTVSASFNIEAKTLIERLVVDRSVVQKRLETICK